MAVPAFIPLPARRININTAGQAHLNGRSSRDPEPAKKVKGTNTSQESSKRWAHSHALPPHRLPLETASGSLPFLQIRKLRIRLGQADSRGAASTEVRLEPQNTPPGAGHKGVLRVSSPVQTFALGCSGAALVRMLNTPISREMQ